MIQERLREKGSSCKCIRCREVRNNFNEKEGYHLYRKDFEASLGHEIFLSLENKNRSKLYSVLRLRVSESVLKHEKSLIPVLTNAALIREVHTYGPVLGIGEKSTNATQHRGFGKKLIAAAEDIAKNEFGLSKMAVIAGVGARQYFYRLGYRLKSNYMIKKLIATK